MPSTCHIERGPDGSAPQVLRDWLAGHEPVIAIYRNGEWTLGLGVSEVSDATDSSDPHAFESRREAGIPTDLQPRGFRLVSFTGQERVWWPKEARVIRGDASWALHYEGEGGALALPFPAAMPQTSRAHWDGMLQAAKDTMKKGELSKVVLARCLELPPCDALQIFLNLRELEPQSKGFFVRDSQGDIFLAVTPETLVTRRDQHVRTHALAGSTGRGADEEEDQHQRNALQSSSKDILEHELVAAYVRENLLRAGVSDLRQSPRRVRTLQFVQHLETIIEGESQAPVWQLVRHLHPTPAVCGTPSDLAKSFIRAHEDFDRGLYAGTIGWFDVEGDGEFLVALRCILCRPHATYAFAGAGILSQSDPESEWQETERKLRQVRQHVTKTQVVASDTN